MRKLIASALMIWGAVLIGGSGSGAGAGGAGGARRTASRRRYGGRHPFDIPYGTPIGLETAKKLIAAVEAEAAKHRWKLNIAVVDTHGDLVHFSRMDGRSLARSAFRKARRAPPPVIVARSRLFYNAFETGHPYVGTLDPTLIASPGGFRWSKGAS